MNIIIVVGRTRLGGGGGGTKTNKQTNKQKKLSCHQVFDHHKLNSPSGKRLQLFFIYTHLPHNPNPTHRVAYTRQSPFLRINTTSFRFYLAYYLYHFHEIGLISRDQDWTHVPSTICRRLSVKHCFFCSAEMEQWDWTAWRTNQYRSDPWHMYHKRTDLRGWNRRMFWGKYRSPRFARA